jgi:hypothetical protein
MTSDEYFLKHDLDAHLRGEADHAFIGGLHYYEVSLREFREIEAVSHSRTIVILDDCLPRSIEMTRRDRQTSMWTGDVWRAVAAIRRYRPDCAVSVLDTQYVATATEIRRRGGVMPAILCARLRPGASTWLDSADA